MKGSREAVSGHVEPSDGHKSLCHGVLDICNGSSCQEHHGEIWGRYLEGANGLNFYLFISVQVIDELI